MAKYEVTCENGSFNASFKGSAADLYSEACCIVLGMYNHMKRSDETGFIAEAFKQTIESGELFDKFDEGRNEKYEEFDIDEGSGDVQ